MANRNDHKQQGDDQRLQGSGNDRRSGQPRDDRS